MGMAETKDAALIINLSVQTCRLNKDCLSLLGKGNLKGLPIHERIRYARLTAGLSAVELAGKLGISKNKMSRYEKGQAKRMDRELLERIAIVCGRNKSFFP
jgi:DNA-binding Xre family transcriptional regulator